MALAKQLQALRGSRSTLQRELAAQTEELKVAEGGGAGAAGPGVRDGESTGRAEDALGRRKRGRTRRWKRGIFVSGRTLE